MNYLDIIILIPLIYLAWKGFKKGFIIEIFTLMALFFGLYAGIHFSDYIANALKANFEWKSKALPVVAFTLTFLAVGAMVYFAGKAIEQLIKVVLLSPLNKLGGILFALIKGIYIIGFCAMLLNSYDPNQKFVPKESKEKSLLYKPLIQFSENTIPGIKNTLFFHIQNQFDLPLNEKELNRAKELADSLNIKTDDPITLTEIYYKHEKNN